MEVQVSVPRPLVDEPAREALDRIDLPLTVAVAVRDRDARLLDFRLEFANAAAARWAGLARGAMVGRLVTDLIPGLRPAGLYDELVEVVASGRPFRQHRQPYEGNVEEGRAFAAIFELLAIRLGDGYLSIWSELPEGAPQLDLEAIAEGAKRVIPLVRLEARSEPSSGPRLETRRAT
jgi:PAS domain-containing protein